MVNRKHSGISILEIEELAKHIGDDLQGDLGEYMKGEHSKGYLHYPYDVARIINPPEICNSYPNNPSSPNLGDYYRLFRAPPVLVNRYRFALQTIKPRLSKKLREAFDLERFIKESDDFRSLFISGHHISEYLRDISPRTMVRIIREIGQEAFIKEMLQKYRETIKKSKRSIDCSWDCSTAPF